MKVSRHCKVNTSRKCFSNGVSSQKRQTFFARHNFLFGLLTFSIQLDLHWEIWSTVDLCTFVTPPPPSQALAIIWVSVCGLSTLFLVLFLFFVLSPFSNAGYSISLVNLSGLSIFGSIKKTENFMLHLSFHYGQMTRPKQPFQWPLQILRENTWNFWTQAQKLLFQPKIFQLRYECDVMCGQRL